MGVKGRPGRMVRWALYRIHYTVRTQGVFPLGYGCHIRGYNSFWSVRGCTSTPSVSGSRCVSVGSWRPGVSDDDMSPTRHLPKTSFFPTGTVERTRMLSER